MLLPPDGLLRDPEATRVRRAFARTAADQIVLAGNTLWAFGMALDHPRRALAVATQTAGGLASGTVTLLGVKNWYAASALLRQFIEAEYLVWLFGDEPAEATDWLTLDGETSRAKFRPARLRKRAAGKFADEEYWTHREVGGHPHPRGNGLLPDHLLVQPRAEHRLEELLWLETAVHVERFWSALAWTSDVLGLRQIVTLNDAKAVMDRAARDWFVCDPLGRDAVEGMAKAAARRASDS
jgi:hypothetical protein